jgi:hypothetical protein
MKRVIIDGKEYLQMEQSDIDRLPPMKLDKDMLKKYNQPERLNPEDAVNSVCDSPISENK